MYGLPKLNLFWIEDLEVKPVPVRDIYKLEYYIFSVCVFMFHACQGWEKVTPVLGVPKDHQPNVRKFGYVIFAVLGAIYISFPMYCILTTPYAGHQAALQPSTPAFIPGA